MNHSYQYECVQHKNEKCLSKEVGKINKEEILQDIHIFQAYYINLVTKR